LLQFRQLGLKVKLIEAFDYEQFYQEGGDYVRRALGQEIGDWHLKNTNLLQVRELVPKFLRTIDWQKRPANLDDLEGLLKNGWLVGIDLNARVLNKRDGYSSHMVVVFDKQNGDYALHDPGLPPHKNRRVKTKDFEAAWSYAGVENRALVALKASKK